MDEIRRRRRTRFKAGVSLDDVAARAEVSTASVSRVLNGTAFVSEEVRRKVQQACDELGYVPNGAARALAASRTMTIGAVVPTLENVGFATAVSALQRSLKQAGYTLLLASSNYESEAEFNEARLLLSRGVDGLMLVGGQHDERLIPLIQQHRVPFVETWTFTAGRPCVGVDNKAAARALTEHLVGMGHKRIAFIAGVTSGNDRAEARKQGVVEYLAEHGRPLVSEWLTEQPYRIEGGRIAMRSILSGADRPTAVICGNDQLAFGAMIEANALGFSVPDDISIAGFNDLEFAAHIHPPLTTVRISTQEIGARAAELLLSAIAGNVPDEPVEIPFVLVPRASTAPPRD